jgi:3-phosphoshikimate 1-carboxyvinyltransferase
MTQAVVVEPSVRLRGQLRVPGDKSASHRALMISSLASGSSTIEGLSQGHDVRSTGIIMGQLGASVVEVEDVMHVRGPEGGLRATDEMLDCGNSGTTMRLLCGLVSAVEGTHHLIGDPSLSKRPMDRVATPLGLMGSVVRGIGERVNAPLTITGSRSLKGIDYHVPTASAQVKSAILFAGLGARGETTVREDIRTRTATEDMFVEAGVDVESRDEGLGRVVTLKPGRPTTASWQIPGDPSQAAFFCVLGAVHPDAHIEILNVDSSVERSGFVAVLQRMGATLTREARGHYSSLVSSSSELAATEIHAHEIPSVDEVPVLTVAAAAAKGVSAFRGMGELRLKESDRFEGSMSLARSLGCRVWSEGDDFFVEGLGSSSAFVGFEIDAALDHRLVMSAAVAGAAGRGCTIVGAETVASSYPQFFHDLDSLQ